MRCFVRQVVVDTLEQSEFPQHILPAPDKDDVRIDVQGGVLFKVQSKERSAAPPVQCNNMDCPPLVIIQRRSHSGGVLSGPPVLYLGCSLATGFRARPQGREALCVPWDLSNYLNGSHKGGRIYGEARHEGFALAPPFFGSWGFTPFEAWCFATWLYMVASIPTRMAKFLPR